MIFEARVTKDADSSSLQKVAFHPLDVVAVLKVSDPKFDECIVYLNSGVSFQINLAFETMLEICGIGE